MTWRGIRQSLFVAAMALGWAVVPLAAQTLEPIAANDNRKPSGELRDGVLTVRLEMRKGNWHPEREDGEAIPVYALAEPGKPLQIPSPAIRVPQGTTIDLSIHSTLTVPATFHGLHQRPGKDADVVTVGPGTTTHVRFLAGAPGTYLYWGRTPDGQRGANRIVDSLLSGALVVDPPGTNSAAPGDRIFVLERWNGPTRTAINGKSWPYTERLDYKVGENVRWKVINGSDLSHPMHLHGFHFNLDAEGDGEHYKTYAGANRPLEFTHSVEIMETFEMSWVPKEPGRWLYHCHRLPHMRLPINLDPADVTTLDNHEHVHGADSDYSGMGGMIMGITVTGAPAEAASANWTAARKLELIVGERSGDPRFYELAIREPGEEISRARGNISLGLGGPPIVLRQHEPVELSVVNHLKEATSIHWHGIELESYYDGVPEWGGIGNQKTPPVEPGQTFVAKMAPPRAGTFIYHTHWHDAGQLTGGVQGALIVLPSGQAYDPAIDKNFVFSQSPADPFGGAMMLMNGVPQPATMQLKTGTKYRFRLINITPSVNNLHVLLKRDGMPVPWRPVAKDAVDLPAASSAMKKADQLIAVSETFDFEYEATAPGELTIEGLNLGDRRRAIQALVFTDPVK